MKDYDIIVIGSGLGGLISATLLGKEGYRVCVLEKNKQIGGALQVYVRNRVIFDTGVHYVGGLDEGQNLNQIFKYLGIMDSLKLKRMNDVFDRILIEGDDKEYVMRQGYDNFIAGLVNDFPDDEASIRIYCDAIRDICSRFALYNLRTGGTFEQKSDVMEIDTKAFIESITPNHKLRDVLAGNNMLYAGQPNKSPFYVHALILNSYIESSWKCVDGGSQIAKLLSRNIHKLGGVIKIHQEVKKLVEVDGRLSSVELSDGKTITADIFISNVHPVQTLQMISSSVIRNSFRKRLGALENSVSSFTIDIILKKDCFPVLPGNYYYHKKGEVWNGVYYDPKDWPTVYAIFMPEYSDKFAGENAQNKNGTEAGEKIVAEKTSKVRFGRSMSILSYMRFDDVKHWDRSFNTVSHEDSRGADYDAFKKSKAEKLLDLVSEKFPDLRDCIDRYYTATPLSYRDYLGTSDGSMYGIVKDYMDPLKTMVSPRTKLPNLFFTGQNLSMHGILGVAMSALQTAMAITGSEHLIDKVREAK